MAKLLLALVGLLVIALLASTAAILRSGPDAVPWGRFLLLGVGAIVQEIVDREPGRELEPGAPSATPTDLVLTHGVAVGDVTSTTATVWTRASRSARVHVEYQGGSMSEPTLAAPVPVSADSDYTASVRLEELEPDARYVYQAWAEEGDRNVDAISPEATGSFRTAPAADTRAAVSFVFGGDLGGSGYCRKPADGYAIFGAMHDLAPSFFVASGDMIYADNVCPAVDSDGSLNISGGFARIDTSDVDWNRADDMRDLYFRHWRYNRGDWQLQQLLRTTPLYAQWDDHEIINDGGVAWSYWNPVRAARRGYSTLAHAARDAFFAYSAIDRDSSDSDRLYRQFSWGTQLDLFRLDIRSYRSRNELADTPANQKTMLGRDQLAWLKSELVASQAIWKFVSGSVPLSIPTGGLAAAVLGRDGWANGTTWDFASQTGFERELLDLVRYLDDHRVENIIFLSADVHFPMIIRYAIDANGDGIPLVFHEIVAGPLSASTSRGQVRLDPTLNPTVLYRESGFFNFAYVRVWEEQDGTSWIAADIRGEDGQPRPASTLTIRAAGGAERQ